MYLSDTFSNITYHNVTGSLAGFLSYYSKCWKKQEHMFQGGKGEPPQFWWSTIIQPTKKEGGRFEPPKTLGPGMKTYRQFTSIHCNLP